MPSAPYFVINDQRRVDHPQPHQSLRRDSTLFEAAAGINGVDTYAKESFMLNIDMWISAVVAVSWGESCPRGPSDVCASHGKVNRRHT